MSNKFAILIVQANLTRPKLKVSLDNQLLISEQFRLKITSPTCF